MKTILSISLILVFLMLPAVGSTESLQDVYQSTYAKLYGQYSLSEKKLDNSINNINEWLQGPLSMQLSALESRDDFGTDEYEVALVIPFRSPLGHSLDKKQRSISVEIAERRKQRFALLVSGLIRQSIWRWSIAETELKGLKNKKEWLDDLDITIKQLLNAGEINRVTFLQWQQQKLAHQMQLKKAELTVQEAKENYKSITGMDNLPDNVSETLVEGVELKVMRHPDLLLLQLTESQLDLNYQQSRQGIQPWEVGLVGRQLKSILGSENLVGVTFNIPISSGQNISASDHATWQEARNALSDTKLETYMKLKSQLSSALHEYRYLQEAQDILGQQVSLGTQINELYSKQQNDLPKSYWLEQLIKQQDLKLELEKNRTALREVISKINQIVGITL